ncbi:flagellar hook-associated protein FlgK [Desulfobulbus rhabdoformis]|uniref:flagellar hook-associated protein FlgK n=1 Tax=Desulfobulbus rhabdoformis TaxID=34032 RepID=UPI001964EBD7|nr:flagellar hook-associated protein FlgK [Desulfobulbus rhabdoformis]MBM9616507.1 flagellar hook-associated protein FlgK [Desulfobulbus rhabdoformis]
MSSLLNALNAGKTSLLTNQKSIEIVGNNIANVNTEGYSRQRAELMQIPSVNFGDFFVGQGVTVSDVSRDYSVFINRQLQDKTIEYGEESGRSNSLSELERIFSVGEDNLASQINDFFDAWQELSANPSGEVERDIVIQRGNLLGEAFASITNELNTVVSNMNTEITGEVDYLNEKIQEIAKLNERISLVEINGQTANAARDQRDLIVQDLSETIGIETYTDSRGMLCVQLPGGKPLVQGNISAQFKAVTEGTNVEIQLETTGVTMDVDIDNLGGRLRGMFEMRDVFIADMQDDLNTLAIDLTDTVNSQHLTGYDSNGVTGRLFFNDITALPVGQVASRNVVLAISDASEIAAAGNPEAAPGDNENALAIAQLEVTHHVGSTGDTFDNYFAKMVANVGIESARNKLALSGAEDASIQLQNLRDGYSGVSLEEEMIDLIQYQRGFESSAKFLSTVDEMMNALLQLKG